MTMSRNLGFLKAGGDVDGVLAQLQKDLDYRGIAMAMPIIDRLVRLNPITKLLGRTTRSGHFAMRSRAILEDRLAEADQSDRKGEVRRPAGQPPDLADRLLEAQRKDPRISEGQLVGYLQTNPGRRERHDRHRPAHGHLLLATRGRRRWNSRRG